MVSYKSTDAVSSFRLEALHVAFSQVAEEFEISFGCLHDRLNVELGAFSELNGIVFDRAWRLSVR